MTFCTLHGMKSKPRNWKDAQLLERGTSVVNDTGFPWGQFADPVPAPCQPHPVSRGAGFVEYPWVGGVPAHPRLLPLSEGAINLLILPPSFLPPRHCAPCSTARVLQLTWCVHIIYILNLRRFLQLSKRIEAISECQVIAEPKTQKFKSGMGGGGTEEHRRLWNNI